MSSLHLSSLDVGFGFFFLVLASVRDGLPPVPKVEKTMGTVAKSR